MKTEQNSELYFSSDTTRALVAFRYEDLSEEDITWLLHEYKISLHYKTNSNQPTQELPTVEGMFNFLDRAVVSWRLFNVMHTKIIRRIQK